MVVSVQDLINKEMFQEVKKNDDNEMLQILEFVRDTGVSLTEDQVKASFLLHSVGLGEIPQFMFAIRPHMTPVKRFFEMVNKITLADRIKGTAKLDKLLKAQVASPSSTMADHKMKPLKEK
jgi:hypothetical protein